MNDDLMTDEQREAVFVLAETLIPEHPGAPSADQAGLSAQFLDEFFELRDDLLPAFLDIVDRADLEDPRGFCDRLQTDEPAAFNTLTFVIAGAYLLSPKARAWLNYGGQVGEAQDSSSQPEYAPGGILDQVRERGPIYRATPCAALPLAGVRVLELGNYIAAPTAGRLLADFGAEVIKIERPGTGDELRNWRLHGGTTSMLFRAINRNKKSVTADLRTEAGRRLVLGLVARSDALIENFRPGTLDRWGLDSATLAEANPDLIIARVSAFGQTGPLSSRPGFAAVAEAYGGLRDLVGDPDRPPSRVGVSIGDSIAGLYAAFGVVMALYQRETALRAGQTPPGPADQQIDVALHEAVFSMMESLVPDHSAHGVIRQRVGGRVEGIAPSNAYLCSDGSSVVIAGNGDSIFRRYMAAIGRPDLAVHPELATNAQRWLQREKLDEAISAWTECHTQAEILSVLETAGVPAGPILTAADIAENDHYAARRMIQTLPVDTGHGVRPVRFPGIVPLLRETSIAVRNVGPDLGEHTRQVLVDVLGMTDAEAEDWA